MTDSGVRDVVTRRVSMQARVDSWAGEDAVGPDFDAVSLLAGHCPACQVTW
jgi:hypothetical protein